MVALSEPMRQTAFVGDDTRDAACRRIDGFARRVRKQILSNRRAPSAQVDGRLDDNMVVLQSPPGELRQQQARQGEMPVRKPLSADFSLLIKHNALFAALLPKLTESFDCLALVRNPVAVLASWQTVNLPVHSGHVPAGERFDQELRGVLAGEPDVLRRQIAVLNWFFASYRKHLIQDNVIRYEELVDSGGLTLFRLLGAADVSLVPLDNRNGNPVYATASPGKLCEALVKQGGAWTEFYSAAECREVANLIRESK